MSAAPYFSEGTVFSGGGMIVVLKDDGKRGLGMSGFRGKPPVGRDRVRLSTVEKQAAVAASKDQRPEFDNDKLLNMLRSAKAELQGMRLIHLHLSLLKDRDPSAQMLVRTILNELSSKASYLQSYNISNGDVIVLYKGLKLSLIHI